MNSNDRYIERRQALLQEGATDGHWRGFFDRDAYIPRLALEWLIDRHRWENWRGDPGAFRRPWAPSGYRYWLELFHDASGLGAVVHYPEGVSRGERITVSVTGLVRNRRREIPWVHGQQGLVEWALTPVLEEMVVLHEALP